MPGYDGPGRDAPDESRGRSRRGRAVRRRDRMVRGIDATGSLAVVGTLLATGVVAGAMQSAAAPESGADTVQLSVAQPAGSPAAPAPRPTQTIYKTVLVTPSPQPPDAQESSGQSGSSGSGHTGSSGSSGSSGSGSSWKPKKSTAPAPTHSTAPAPQPQPSASSAGS